MKYSKPYHQPRKTALALAITTSIGVSSLSNTALADVYVWGSTGAYDLTTSAACDSARTDPLTEPAEVIFTMLDSAGAILKNSSTTTKGANAFQTPTCGTLTYDTETESGTVGIGAFDFYNGGPAVAAGISIAKVPSGLDDGSGNLMLANMLFNWSTTDGIPVSLVWDAGPLLNEMDGTPTTATLSDAGGGTIDITPVTDGLLDASESTTIPGSDGTYSDGTWGYLSLGSVPLATTEYNTTNTTECITGDCLTVNPSADIDASSAVIDNAANPFKYAFDDGFPDVDQGMGGNPMQDGPFPLMNANFDFTSMKLTSFTDTTVPVLTMNGTATMNLTVGDTYLDPGATCTDAAPLNTVITVAPAGDTVDTGTAATYYVTYDCADGSSNAAATQTRTVNVTAAGTPEITLSGITPVTHECATVYTDDGATAVAGDGTTDITGDITTDIDASNPDVNAVSGYTLSYDVLDGSTPAVTVTRTVNVVDTTIPAVVLLGNDPDLVASSTNENPVPTYTDPGATVVDSCDTSLSSPISATSGLVTMIVPDTGPVTVNYALTYSATDADGNIGTVSRTVTVERSQPVISLVGTQTIVLNVGDTYTEQGMDITDAQDADVTGVTTNGTNGSIDYTISGTVDTSTNGKYFLTYEATDSNGNTATAIERTVQVGVYAVNSNFTMLDPAGLRIGGTNDVVMDWDDKTYNTNESDTNFFVTIVSEKPEPFKGFPWYAHHVRVFEGPATYSFNSGCSVAELEATGCPVGSGTPGPTMTMTIEAGQIGAHMLFDWSTTKNIDVVNVWNRDDIWDDHGDAEPKNALWTGDAGDPPDVTAPWLLVSTDYNGDGINSSPMVDGPFEGFYASFNIGPGGVGEGMADITTTAPDTKLGSGTLSWGMLLGIIPLIAWLRRRIKR